jgi:hypothetical protein
MKHAKIRKYYFVILFWGLLSTSCRDANTIAVIDHEFCGCFGYSRDKLTVYSNNGEFVATLNTIGQQSKRAKLNKSQVDFLNSFIWELRNLKEKSGCTTVETYTLIAQDTMISKEDGGCDWKGFDRLVNSLFDKSR